MTDKSTLCKGIGNGRLGHDNTVTSKVDTREETGPELVAGGLYLTCDSSMGDSNFIHQLQQSLEILIVVFKPVAKDEGTDDI